jgi:putative FmdB family regulatory protein
MLYDYKCDNCSHELIDVYQSIHDEALVKCPNCGKDSLIRVIYGGVGSFMKDVKTIGQLADSNWGKMGHYQKSELEAKRKQNQTKEESAFSFAGNATKKEINKMSAEQQKKYIMTGDK